METDKMEMLHSVGKHLIIGAYLTAFEIPKTPKGVPIIYEVIGVEAIVNGMKQRATVRLQPNPDNPEKGHVCRFYIATLSDGNMKRNIGVDFDQVKKDLWEAKEIYEKAKEMLLKAIAAGAVGETLERFENNRNRAAEDVELLKPLYNDDARTACFDKMVLIERDESPNVTDGKATLVERRKTAMIAATALEEILRPDISPEVRRHVFKRLLEDEHGAVEEPPSDPVLAEPAAKPAPTGLLDDHESPMEQELRKLAEHVPEPKPRSELVIDNRDVPAIAGIEKWDPWTMPPIAAEASEPREPTHAEEAVTFEEVDDADETDKAIVDRVREKTVPEQTREYTVEEAQILHESEATVPPHILGRTRKNRVRRWVHNYKHATAALSLIGLAFIAFLLFKKGPETIDWTKRSVASISDKARAVAEDAREKIAEATAAKPEPTPMPTEAPPEPPIVAEAPEPPPDIPLFPLPMPEPEPAPQPEAVAEANPTPEPEPTLMSTEASTEPTIVAEAPEPTPEPAPQPEAVAEANPTPEPPHEAVATKPEPMRGRLYASAAGWPQVDGGRYVVEVNGQLYVANTTVVLENGEWEHTNLEQLQP